MTSIRFLKFLLLLLLHQVYSEEAELVVRAQGSNVEMGYCFGVDYIVVYRCAPDGDQLLGNSSADSMPITPPADLQGRVRVNGQQDLLGLQILNLQHKDSGIYRRECWKNGILVSQFTQQLYVCNEEVESVEITVREEDGGAELLCNYTSIGLDGTSVRWYKDMYPSYRSTLFLDSSVSLDTELQGVVVRDNGVLLLLDNSTLKYNHQFLCLVSKGKNCLSFQSMHLPDRSESCNIFASQGDRVVLKCPSDGDNQQWETPLGTINGSSVKMHISRGDRSEDFSLVIPAISDEHSGDYSCISSTLESNFRLALCPKKVSQEKVVVEGGSILLDCVEDDYKVVEWHRRKPSSDSEVIHVSAEKTIPIPEDLRGRVTVSKNGSSLMISHMEMEDQGVYWCIVLRGTEFLEEDYSSEDDYDEEDIGDDDYSDGISWGNTPKCIFKQETTLTVILESPPVHPPRYAVAGGLVGLLVVGVIVAVIAVKKAKASPKWREAASRSGLNTTNDVKLNMESECTQSLTHNNE
ncbi:uncharacterized protein LOC125886987 isoform X2 [Epinephelus fuscoguttatus]|uniref:uncharacterized protein LOC125886987 isoform X2 n=1 Tax=Epinephelus fuscoguttatus TaxID=293821 RepID=UPI0020D0B01F|nr:uncharacterized protein LOC125886987 isoform X2 [Epinephelus fuscoguttatus]